ncbi:MAG: hypothetical protein ABUS48_06910 [Pseudomonadota bacterium]
MRPIHLLAAVAFWGFAQAAVAAPISIAPVAIDAKLQTTIQDDLGQREGDYLVRALTDEVTEALERQGAQVTPDAGVRLEITLVNAQPNHPTFAQMGRPPFLDMSSVSIGGAEIRGVLRAQDGRVLAEFTEENYDQRLDEFTQASSTWTAARRAIQHFARRVAMAYRANVASS